MQGYIEIVGAVAVWDVKLTFWDRWMIGHFTRENVMRWIESRTRMSPELYPVDFHAACGGQDIPWATKEGFEQYQRCQQRLC